MNIIKKLLCLAVVCMPMMMQAQGIKFEEGLTWNQVLQKAKAENKYIFVDCYATWCAPCKIMDKSVYPNDTVGSFFNEKFVSVKVQMDTTKSDNDFTRQWYADASMMDSKYNITAFPSFLFFSPNGDIVHRDVGAKRPEDLITVGTDALNPNEQYYVMLEKYNRNQLDPAHMKALVYKVQYVEGDELAAKIANAYVNRLPTDSLFTQDNIHLIYDFTKTSKEKGFAIFRDSAKRISETDKQWTEGNCKGFVLNIIYNEEIKPYQFTKKGKPDWKKIKTNLEKYGSLGDEAFTKFKPSIIFKTEIEPELKINSDWNYILPLIQKQNLGKNAEFVVGSTIVYYLNGVAINHTEKNCKNLVSAATYYADSFSTFLSANALNTWAWILFENSNDKEELLKASEWSKLSLELEPGGPKPEELDTYANVLYKRGLMNDAIAWEQKAVDAAEARAKRNNIVAEQVYRETLEKMNKGKKTWPEK